MKKNKIMMMAAIAATLVSCGGGGGRPTFGDNEFPVVTVGTQSAASQATYPASIKGVQDVQISPKVGGFITQINVKEGQTVSAGQVLFVIDNATYQAQVRQMQAAVNTAQAACNTAKLSYENSKKLYESKVIGDFELQSATNSYESAKAALAQAQAGLASAKETLSFCYVKSPASGVVGTLPLKVGALVSAASVLTTVNPEKLLKSGGSGAIVIPHSNSSAIVIPQACVSEVQNKKFVYTLGKDNKVQYTEIQVAPQNDGQNYVVTDGLKVGDKYITNGITKLTDQMEIVPITPERYQQKIQEQAKAMSAGDIVNAMKK